MTPAETNSQSQPHPPEAAFTEQGTVDGRAHHLGRLGLSESSHDNTVPALDIVVEAIEPA